MSSTTPASPPVDTAALYHGEELPEDQPDPVDQILHPCSASVPVKTIHPAGQASAMASLEYQGAGSLPEDAALDGHQGHLRQQPLLQGEDTFCWAVQGD